MRVSSLIGPVFVVGCGYHPMSLQHLSLATSGSVAPVEVAVTVDDLPSVGHLPPDVTRDSVVEAFIAAFQKHHIDAPMGFLNAIRVDQRPALRAVLQSWRDAGYGLGNHTYSHKNLESVTLAEFEADFERDEPLLKEIAGDTDYRWFRFPYLAEGETEQKYYDFRKYLAERGYRIAPVDFDFEDYQWNDPYARCARQGDDGSVERLQQSYLASANAALDKALEASNLVDHRTVPLVLLLHIGAFDALMLDDLLTQLEGRGVTFVYLTSALGDPIYGIEPGQSSHHYSNFLDRILEARGKTPPHLTLPIGEVQAACE